MFLAELAQLPLRQVPGLPVIPVPELEVGKEVARWVAELLVGSVEEFPCLDPPDYRMIRDGYQTLHELAAIDEDNRLTDIGHALARLPIDPRIARMVLAARDESVMDEVLIIAAALSVQDPRERPMDQQEAADAAHQKFRDPKSDFLSYLKLWNWYHEQAASLSTSKLRKLCQENFLSFVRLREWHDVHGQLHAIVGEMGLNKPPHDSSPRYRAPS